jgi:hypothetical protein
LSLGPRKPPSNGAAVDPATVATIRIRYDNGKKRAAKAHASATKPAQASGDIDGL